MTKLEILGKVEGLAHADVAVVLEHHHGHGASRDHVSNDELCQNIEAKLNVGDGLHDTNGDQPENGDENAQEVGPNGEPSWPASDDANGDGDHDDEESCL